MRRTKSNLRENAPAAHCFGDELSSVMLTLTLLSWQDAYYTISRRYILNNIPRQFIGEKNAIRAKGFMG